MENYSIEMSFNINCCESFYQIDEKSHQDTKVIGPDSKGKIDEAAKEAAQLIFFAPTADFQENILESAFLNEGFDAISKVSKINCNLAKMQVSSFHKAIDIISSFHDKQIRVNQQQPPLLTLSSNESIKLCELLLGDLNLKQVSQPKSLKKEYNQNKSYKGNLNVITSGNGINVNTRPVEVIIEKIPNGVDMNDLLSVFSRCGRVEGIKAYQRSSDDNLNSASLTYSNISMAQKAIRYFDGKFRMNESTIPLSVRIINESK